MNDARLGGDDVYVGVEVEELEKEQQHDRNEVVPGAEPT